MFILLRLRFYVLYGNILEEFDLQAPFTPMRTLTQCS